MNNLSATLTEHLEEKAPGRGRNPGPILTLANKDKKESAHERATLAKIAESLARLTGRRFDGACVGERDFHAGCYLVPSETISLDTSPHLGGLGEADLFGGVTSHAFMATKAITHPTVDADAAAPAGWSNAFSRRVAESVHRGYSAFARQEARKAVARLLERGAVRFKPVLATAGRGQEVVTSMRDLEPLLERLGDDELARFGLTLEENIGDVETFSVGQVRVADIVASYVGTQTLTRDNLGAQVYGGSRLKFVRGGFDALLARDLPSSLRLAIEQAQTFDSAADACLGRFVASRRNYDVAQGRAAGGSWRSGVLEQSWRTGGASSAEVIALQTFYDDPSLMDLRASSVELYGDGVRPPPGAEIFFSGVDETVGPLTKYAVVETNGRRTN